MNDEWRASGAWGIHQSSQAMALPWPSFIIPDLVIGRYAGNCRQGAYPHGEQPDRNRAASASTKSSSGPLSQSMMGLLFDNWYVQRFNAR